MRALLLLAVAVLIFAGPARALGPDDARAGADALAEEDYQIAILHYTAAIRAPDLPPAQLALSYRQRGIAHLESNRADLAILDFTSAIWLAGLDDDQTTATYYNRGLAYEMLGESRLAIGDFTTAIERNLRYAEAYNSRGHIYLKLGQYEHALADFTASYRQNNPELHLPMYGMALTYEAMGRVDEAKSWFSRCLSEKPDFEPALEKLHPDQVALDAAPVPAIDSAALLPTSQSDSLASPSLRRALDESEEIAATGESEMPINVPQDPAGEALASETELDNLPTLIDEPVPPESGDVREARVTPKPQPKPSLLEPAAAPPGPGIDALQQHVPARAGAMQVAADEDAGAELPKRQASSADPSATETTRMASIPPIATPPAQADPKKVFQIQLGSYASPAIAESEAMRLKEEHQDLLGRMSHLVERASVGTKTYFRLRGVGLSRNEALHLCKELRARNHSCMVSGP